MEKRTENVCADGKSEAKMEREKRNNSNQLGMIMVGKRHHQKYPFDDLPHVRMYLYLSIYLYMSMVIQRYSATPLHTNTTINSCFDLLHIPHHHRTHTLARSLLLLLLLLLLVLTPRAHIKQQPISYS